ncbi:MAG: transposase [Psychromonas sp.]|nr:transposase [Psychromonas sp.]
MVGKVISAVISKFKLVCFVCDGAFENNAAIEMISQLNMCLISKLRNNSTLYFNFTGEYSGKGRSAIYAERIDYKKFPSQYLMSTKTECNVPKLFYQIAACHKKIQDSLNIVIVHKENLTTGKCANVISFCTD